MRVSFDLDVPGVGFEDVGLQQSRWRIVWIWVQSGHFKHSGDSMVVLTERQSWLRLKNTFVIEISAVK